MPEPITTVGVSAVLAYLGKDGLNKMLGPTADYLGDSLKDFAQKRAENVGKIFSNAEKKLGDRINQPGQVPPKVLKTIINEGSYSDDVVAVEYFGGILASSRTEQGRDDRGSRIGKTLDGLSSYQIRTHYYIYSLVREIFTGCEYKFNMNDRSKMEIFIPFNSYIAAMEFNDAELSQISQLITHVFFGLSKEDLIETFQYGPKENIKKHYAAASANEGGILVTPSAFGGELFLWGYGLADKNLSYILGTEPIGRIDSVPVVISGVESTKKI